MRSYNTTQQQLGSPEYLRCGDCLGIWNILQGAVAAFSPFSLLSTLL